MHYLITGAAGFIGSHLTDRLLSEGHTVSGYDNLSTGRWGFLTQAFTNPNFRFIRGDVLDMDCLTQACAGVDVVCHLAANADVRSGLQHPTKDLEQNIVATSHVLEAMRTSGVSELLFSSTGSVYGEPAVFPTPEDCPFPIQTSLYGASKLACEGLIAAYCAGYGFRANIYRFVSILGERYSHGHLVDFYRQLQQDRTTLRVLGNGHQRKSYLYVQDCISAMLLAHRAGPPQGLSIYNLGTNDAREVRESIAWMTDFLQVSPTIHYTEDTRGWVGDNPFIHLDCTKIRSLGWVPSLSIREGVLRTVGYLQHNPWLVGN